MFSIEHDTQNNCPQWQRWILLSHSFKGLRYTYRDKGCQLNWIWFKLAFEQILQWTLLNPGGSWLLDNKHQAMSQNFFEVQRKVIRMASGLWKKREEFASLSRSFFSSDWLGGNFNYLCSYWVKGPNGCHWGGVLAVAQCCRRKNGYVVDVLRFWAFGPLSNLCLRVL